MSPPLVPTITLILALIYTIYRYIIHPLFFSPLRNLPTLHWTSRFTPLYILSQRLAQNDTPTIHAAHQRLGPIILLAPSEISINCIKDGIRTIYAGGFEKGNWYSNVFSNYGVEPMFAMEGSKEHSKRKRMLSNVYAKSTLQGSAALTKQTEVLIRDRLRARLLHDACRGEEEEEEGSGEVEMYDIFSAVTMDFVSGYVFGLRNCSDFIRDKEAGVQMFHDFKARQKYTFWPQECPILTRMLKRLGLKWLVVPSWVDDANNEIEAWLMDMCEKAEETLKQSEEAGVEDYPTVYAQLRNMLVKERSKVADCKTEDHVRALKLEIASELLDHTLAGFDTSGITLTWLAWRLSRPEGLTWQAKLRGEIATLGNSLDAKDIDALPVLHAILMETLRLHAAIPGNQPRVTPSASLATLGDAEEGACVASVPAGIRVQSQAYSLHRNPKVFPDPDIWNPGRWLHANAEQQREMARWFWAFGSGGRMCVGSNLAVLDMKATIAGLWGSFQTEVADDEGMVPNGGYMAEPLGVGPGGVKGIGGKYAAGGGERRFLRVRIKAIGRS